MLLPLFQWFEATAIGTVVRESLWLFPVIECVHLLALALLGGTVLIVDLRLLGIGLTSETQADLARKTAPWMNAALFTIIVTGIAMFLSEALKCYYSPPFWYKISLLLVAVLYAYTIRRRKLSVGQGGPVTGLVSMALWFGVAFSGRWIAFY